MNAVLIRGGTVVRAEEVTHGADVLVVTPLRERGAREGPWRGGERGAIHPVGNDHYGYVLNQYEGCDDFAPTGPGIPGVETTLTVLHSAGVASGRLQPRQLVRPLAWNPARVFGPWPQRGELASGLDADVVLYDPRPEWRLSAANGHGRAGCPPHRGLESRGGGVRTICRGRTVWKEGEVTGEAVWDRYLERRPFEARLVGDS
ncbi:MAG TPA: hypothetical protein VFD49_08175 [Candidatus Dormibacteraeota bacterium]|nr:hypothetical protein [Candidatus Dormibacteraeota bacterium]